MTENQGTAAVTEPTAPPPETPPEEKMVPVSRLNGIAEEAKRHKSEATALAKRLAEIEARDAAAAEAESIKRNEFDKVLQDRESKIAELNAKLESAAIAARKSEARALLSSRGMTNPLAQEGALASVPTDGEVDLETWVTTLAEKYPAEFAPAHRRAPGVPAPVAPSEIGGLDARLNNPDPAVRKAAQAEWMRKNMPGVQ